MSLSTNKALVKSYVEEVFNNHDISATDKYLAENEKFKKFKESSLTPFFTAFPDIHADIEHIVEEDNLVVVFLNFTATHRGVFQGRPPTNKTVNTRSAGLYKIENEKIVEHWDVVDRLDLLQQIGAITFKQANQE
ncbi:MAG: ester cyclase [Nitrosopumilus sp.]|nr:ester cyclase [Nitrosopumilus sp.]